MDYAKDYAKMIQQMTGFYKSAIDNSVNAMTMIKKNTEKLVGNSLEQSPWFSAEGKKFVNAWMNAYKKGYDDLKTAAAAQYKKLEAFVNRHPKS